jgi:para-nitrobenzyl esterase
MRKTAWVCFVLVVSAAFGLPPAGIQDPVRVDSGQISGAVGHNAAVKVYKGIPYAAPPVGDLRWKEPQPVAAWKGVRQATEFGSECMQTPYAENSLYYLPPRSTGEDCLTLNVWTAAKSAAEKRPVMVWIHGGAFTRGSGDLPTYDGESFAAKGVVLVTINYRLGVFGFYAHPELSKESPHHVSGNYALLDQIAALQWVKKNIAAFGGDPGRVTIFGESAGSWAVNLLMATPLSKGLFHRVIGESGANFNRRTTLAQAEQAGTVFADRLGAKSLSDLRAKPAEDLLKAGGGAAPCVDGWFLPESVADIFAHGKQNDVPLLAGYNQDEATSLTPPLSGGSQAFLTQVKGRYTKMADDFLKAYPADSDAQAAESYNQAFRDTTFGWEMRTWVRQQSKTGKSKAYLYFFTRNPPGPTAARYRAYHASEIAYVFGNLLPPRPWEDADRSLSDAMSSYWVNFAATGDPNGKGLPPWPAYAASEDASIVFGDKIEVRRDVNKVGLDFFDRFFGAQAAQVSGGAGNR